MNSCGFMPSHRWRAQGWWVYYDLTMCGATRANPRMAANLRERACSKSMHKLIGAIHQASEV